MSRFVQLHLLTVYPPANLNRDDLGRPKTAVFGNVTRLRVSSQSLKRAIRTSDGFRAALAGQLGDRTKRIGELVERHLLDHGIAAETARRHARTVADCFGKLKKEDDDDPTHTEQLAFVSPTERELALDAGLRLARGEVTEVGVKDVLRRTDKAVDIAMFGRMLADDPDFNREAAVQVAHAITTHKAVVEDDYWTAVDDLKSAEEDAGAGMIGDAGFGSGVFYLYVCIDRALLVRNLGGDAALAARGIAAFVEAAATTSPRGKQASFASRARASFIMVEKGDDAPRTLAVAFMKPVEDAEMGLLAASAEQLKRTRRKIEHAYGESGRFRIMDLTGDEPAGTLAEVVAFAAEA